MTDSYRVSRKAHGAKEWTDITEFCSSIKLKLSADADYVGSRKGPVD